MITGLSGAIPGLTIVATIFLPLTVITSFFGQNFGWLINHIRSAWPVLTWLELTGRLGA